MVLAYVLFIFYTFTGASAIVSTGWRIKLKSNQYGSLELPNKYFNPLRLLRFSLEEGFCDELVFQVRNTSQHVVHILENETIGIVSVLEHAQPTFRIVNCIENPSEIVEADSTE